MRLAGESEEEVQAWAEQLNSLREKRWGTLEIGPSPPLPPSLELVIVDRINRKHDFSIMEV